MPNTFASYDWLLREGLKALKDQQVAMKRGDTINVRLPQRFTTQATKPDDSRAIETQSPERVEDDLLLVVREIRRQHGIIDPPLEQETRTTQPTSDSEDAPLDIETTQPNHALTLMMACREIVRGLIAAGIRGGSYDILRGGSVVSVVVKDVQLDGTGKFHHVVRWKDVQGSIKEFVKRLKPMKVKSFGELPIANNMGAMEICRARSRDHGVCVRALVQYNVGEGQNNCRFDIQCL